MKTLEVLVDIVYTQKTVSTNRLKPFLKKIIDIYKSQLSIIKSKQESIDKLNKRNQQLENKIKKLRLRIEELDTFSQ